MNQKAKDFIKSNTLDLESNNRMDSTGYVQYAVSEAKAYGAIKIAEDALKNKAIEAFKQNCINLEQGNCRLHNDCDKCTRLIRFIELLNLNQ